MKIYNVTVVWHAGHRKWNFSVSGAHFLDEFSDILVKLLIVAKNVNRKVVDLRKNGSLIGVLLL